MTAFCVQDLCSLHRGDSSSKGWNFEVDQKALMWPHMQYIFHGRKEQFQAIALEFMSGPVNSYRIESILSITKHIKSLRILDFSNNFITDIADIRAGEVTIGSAIGVLLSESLCLETLTFKNCKLPEGTWEYAAEGLMNNKSLKRLDLSQSEITLSEAVRIFDALTKNQVLEEIDLSKNQKLRSDDTSKLSHAIEITLMSNTSLRSVNMKDSINDVVAERVVIGLYQNTALKEFGISEQLLQSSTVQQFLMFLDQTCPRRPRLVQLNFAEVTIRSSQDVWSDIIGIIVEQNKFSISESIRNTCNYVIKGVLQPV